jgi:hypothetical protein
MMGMHAVAHDMVIKNRWFTQTVNYKASREGCRGKCGVYRVLCRLLLSHCSYYIAPDSLITTLLEAVMARSVLPCSEVFGCVRARSEVFAVRIQHESTRRTVISAGLKLWEVMGTTQNIAVHVRVHTASVSTARGRTYCTR